MNLRKGMPAVIFGLLLSGMAQAAAPCPGPPPATQYEFLDPPAKSSNATGLVAIIHGYISNPDSPCYRDLEAHLRAKLGSSWDVLNYNWRADSFRYPRDIFDDRNEATAELHGQHLARWIINQATATGGYHRVHLIGMSLGSRVANAACTVLRQAETPHLGRGGGKTMIHATFLDAWVPHGWHLVYGQSATWAEQAIYFGDNPHTDHEMPRARNFDVTYDDLGYDGVHYKHSGPIYWYDHTVQTHVPGVNRGFGFDLSMAHFTSGWGGGSAGSSSIWTPGRTLTLGSDPAYPEDHTRDVMVSTRNITPIAKTFAMTVDLPAQRVAGDHSNATLSPGVLTLKTTPDGGFAYARIAVNFTNPANCLDFKFTFDSPGVAADGMLSVCIDDSLVTLQRETFAIGRKQAQWTGDLIMDPSDRAQALTGPHALCFRLDPIFAAGVSSLKLSDIRTALVAPVGGLARQAPTATETSRVIRVRIIRSTEYKFEQLLAGPDKPEDLPAWLASLRAYKKEMQALLKEKLGKMKDPYSEPALQWAQRSFIQPQMMMHDRYFYDPVAGRYTVRRYLQDLATRYGGIDSVLLWPPMYTNLGVDDRNQFDIWRDMPGGRTALRQMVAEFQRQGVRVLLPIMNWDHGTRNEGVPMAEGLAKLAKDLGADGLNGDTMFPVGREFYDEALKIGHPVALEPEAGMGKTIDGLAWNVLSWGYWWPNPNGPYPSVPAVDRYKIIEPRHLTHVCDRWAHDRTDMLQYAFFNGDGYESWENIFGVWNQITSRDAEALRQISAIYRALPELLISPDYEPFTPTLQKDIYATRFPSKNATLWTFINRASARIVGAQIQVPFSPGLRFFDLWRGSELPPQVAGDKATLFFELEPRGYGAVLAKASSPARPVKELLATMRRRSPIKLSDLSSEWKVLTQHMVEIPLTPLASRPPEGMVRIPAGNFKFEVEWTMRWDNEGADVQYPWEEKPSQKHSHELSMKSYYIDKTPVTCAEFKRFLDATHYRPKDSHNFLRDWVNGSFPEGWAKKPVTWISINDARAYAKWAGKRLPHEWEWQYAAQGTDGRLYPWGKEKDDTRVPPFEEGRDQRPPTDVDAYPQGASPFGVLDLVGNVWQWTDEFQDEHNRAAVLRGGSYYRPAGSVYYFPQAHQLNQHGKYWLLADCTDRSATIGFRCVVDAE